ncbi:spore coat protein U-like protein [Nitrospirillum viridazoti]|uniref:Spore coat protein U-like protein n=2 Tax=Nitrospirillum TaxID=1543705 RepID=A0A560J6S4_9PROT|nr:spore coat protein U-like protein [Nitrospirillum amazonense]
MRIMGIGLGRQGAKHARPERFLLDDAASPDGPRRRAHPLDRVRPGGDAAILDTMDQPTRLRPPFAARFLGVHLWALLALTLLMALPATPARALQTCFALLSGLSQVTPVTSYDPFAALQPPTYNTVTVQYIAGSNCTFGIGIDSGLWGSTRRMLGLSGNWLSYDLYKDAALTQRVGDYGTGNVSNLITGSVNNGRGTQTATTGFYASVPAGQLVGSNYYFDQVTVTLYQLNSSGNIVAVMDSAIVQVRATVRTSVSATVNVGGVRTNLGASAANVDFGELTTGASRSFDLEVSGNTGYSVSIQSQNGGRLVNNDAGTSIPYSMTVDGRGVPSSGTTLTYYSYSSLDRHTFIVVIGDVTKVIAGTYTDYLLMTVTAN